MLTNFNILAIFLLPTTKLVKFIIWLFSVLVLNILSFIVSSSITCPLFHFPKSGSITYIALWSPCPVDVSTPTGLISNEQRIVLRRLRLYLLVAHPVISTEQSLALFSSFLANLNPKLFDRCLFLLRYQNIVKQTAIWCTVASLPSRGLPQRLHASRRLKLILAQLRLPADKEWPVKGKKRRKHSRMSILERIPWIFHISEIMLGSGY